jgi:hypothetical protein
VTAKKPNTVLVLRTCDDKMQSRGGFQWPDSGPVEAPDWSPVKECGHGLHGWLWGCGDWSLKAEGDNIWWVVVEVVKGKEIINLGGKVKFRRGNVVGKYRNWPDAMKRIREQIKFTKKASATKAEEHASATGHSCHASALGRYGHASALGHSGHASALGDYGHASALGDYGHASALGDYGHASALGHSGHASALGHSGHASALGHSCHASALGDYGHASALGHSGHASAGYEGHAKAGENGVISILYWCEKEKRPKLAVGYVGKKGIKKDTFYCVQNGKLKPVA